ncbi:M20/M25/M40 family metallo-hydrolase [Roseivirga sp. BDSF3-8]|uniref:M20/M25/M40 family metallo-hydrolase n=1 Tax=Roseivirga sp. BDSF3-8 TaxID=3241598 RepID=UPI0035323079
MRILRILLAPILLSAWLPAYAQIETDSAMATVPVADTISSPEEYSDLAYWVGVLASDSLRGRANGTADLDSAASFIATWYDSLGLAPVPGMDSFMQDYTVRNTVEGQNVVGWLEGSDSILKDEYIILSAHYDHVGMGKAIGGDSLYNGANDNASGVATIMAIAKEIQEREMKPARSLLFVAFGAEEIGLLGSKYFSEHSPVPLENVALNLNFEMTGHSLKLGKRNVYITGAKYSELKEYMEGEFEDENWTLIENPFPYANLFYRSDNANLAQIKREGETIYGIPAHTVCTWGGEDHYHKPHDEAAFIDYENMRSLAMVMTDVVLGLANREERIKWTDDKFRPLAKEGAE